MLVVDQVLSRALSLGASDIHLAQRDNQITVRFRVEGRLSGDTQIDDGETSKVMARIKALAKLVTYRGDVPQEGRLHTRLGSVEARVSIIPILGGERAVIRLGIPAATDWLPSQLGLGEDTTTRLETALGNISGVILFTGPAGSGKTTSAYACLRYLLREPDARSIVSLEDPVECEMQDVAQSQIDPDRGYDWSTGMKAILRQDPEIMFVGEIRDSETARIVFQAAMTGQLVISTMHARSTADAIRRLLDMNVPAHHVRSCLDFLSCQRLFPTLCECQSVREPKTSDRCTRCHGTGYSKRVLLAELLPPVEGELARTVVADASASDIQTAALQSGLQALSTLEAEAVEAGLLRHHPMPKQK